MRLKRLKVGLLLTALSTPAARGAAYESVVAALKQNPRTVEALLPKLPAEMRENFTFVYQSRSPHGGLGDPAKSSVDKKNPRVVLFSNDGRVTLAFTGHPNKPGYDVVEMIHFNDQKAAFELSRYVLPAAAEREPELKPLAAENGQTNPAACLRCHGADPRPISDSYPLWPGFYGSVRDTFPKGSPELRWYREFLKEKKNTGVYQHLTWPKGTSVPPYMDPKRYNKDATEESVNEMKFLPNTRLGMAWTELNRKRIQRKMKASPFYQKYRYALLAGFMGCQNLPVTETQANEVYQVLTLENTDRIQRLGTVPQGPGTGSLDMMELGFYGNAVQIVYLAKALQLSYADWALAFEKDSLSLFDGILSSIYDGKNFYLKEDFMLEMLRDLAQDDPKFAPFFRTEPIFTAYGYPFGERLDFGAALGACSTLLKKIREEKTVLPEIADLATVTSAADVLPEASVTRCTKCHEGAAAIEIGRKIPFTNPTALRAALNTPSARGKLLYDDIIERVTLAGPSQMPPHGDRLSAGETQSLVSYLDKVRKNL